MGIINTSISPQHISVVKVGSRLVSNPEMTALDLDAIGHIGQRIRTSEDAMRDVGRSLHTVLVSSGAVPAGIERLGLSREDVDNDLTLKRVSSMVGNLALNLAWEEATGYITAPDLPTHNDLDSDESWSHLSSAIKRALVMGLLPILNDGDARSSEELVTTMRANGKDISIFGDNDQLAAHTAVQLGARSLYFLTASNGVLEDVSDPSSTLKEIRVSEVDDFIAQRVDDSSVSNGGMASKLQAARYAAAHGVELVRIANGRADASERARIGTHIVL